MNAQKKLTALLLALLTVFSLFCSCAKKTQVDQITPSDNPTGQTSPDNAQDNTTLSSDSQNETDNGEDTPEPTFVHPLTGLPCNEADSKNRPVAIMIDNEVNYKNGDYHNLGLAEADVIFETNIESNGSGTRMMAIFSQSTLSQEGLEVGGVRSARPYFLQLAKMLDAYYVHEGTSSTDDVLPSSVQDPNYYARTMLWNGYLDRLELGIRDGISYRPDSETYQKLCVVSSAIVAKTAPLLNELISLYPRSTYAEGRNNNLFLFGDADQESRQTANSVRIEFSNHNSFYTQSKFTYDETTKTYIRSQYLYPRVYNEDDDVISTDIKTNEPLSFTNVLVLVTNQYPCDKDLNGSYYHTKVDLVGYSGHGYYFTEGKYIPITWECESDTSPIRYYTEDGNELVVNAGKTFINLIDTEAESQLEIK